MIRCYVVLHRVLRRAVRPLRRAVRHAVHWHAHHAAAVVVATVVCIGGPIWLVHHLPPTTQPPALPDPAPVNAPEPGTLALLGVSVAGLAAAKGVKR